VLSIASRYLRGITHHRCIKRVIKRERKRNVPRLWRLSKISRVRLYRRRTDGICSRLCSLNHTPTTSIYRLSPDRRSVVELRSTCQSERTSRGSHFTSGRDTFSGSCRSLSRRSMFSRSVRSSLLSTYSYSWRSR